MLTKAEYNNIADVFDELALRSRQVCALSEVIASAVPNLPDDDSLQTALGLLNEMLEANDTLTGSLQKRLLDMQPK